MGNVNVDLDAFVALTQRRLADTAEKTFGLSGTAFESLRQISLGSVARGLGGACDEALQIKGKAIDDERRKALSSASDLSALRALGDAAFIAGQIRQRFHPPYTEPHPRALEMIAEAIFRMGLAVGLQNGEAASKTAAQEVSRLFARNGGIGGKLKAERTKPLKKWIAENDLKKRTDKNYARELERSLPDHLRVLSKDPEGFIYKTLRKPK